MKEQNKTWYRLDTAALIFPVITRSDWCNVFRVSATLREPIDAKALQEAVDALRKRFPSFYVCLRRGVFWYRLEPCRERVRVRPDYAYPLAYMSRREMGQSCLRVLCYENRIAVEFFHVITDGRGGMIFLQNLTAAYLRFKYGVTVPPEGDCKELLEPPRSGELEDSFFKNAAPVAASRRESDSYRLHGEKEPDGVKRLITGVIDTEALLREAHRCGVSVTAYLAAVMAESILELQRREKPLKRQKPVKITIPVDLRRLYGSETLRNFSLVLNLGVDPRFGDYSLEELAKSIYHQLCAGATRQNMAGMIAANVQPQQNLALRLAPLSVKRVVMREIYKASERKGCINLSNLGLLRLPETMRPYVERMEFIIGPQRGYPNNCSVLSLGGKTFINMIRSVRGTELERLFFSRLVEQGIAVDIESN